MKPQALSQSFWTLARPAASSRAQERRGDARGFSLIDLLIAMAVVAILTAVALPSYQQYVLQSRRGDAKTALLDLAAREERYYTVNNTYTNEAGPLNYVGGNVPLSHAIGSSTLDYTLTITNATATAYTLQAVPLPIQAADTSCGTYQLDNFGNQLNIVGGAPAAVVSGCW